MKYTIEIKQDDFMESPREGDNLGTMACFHRRYNLGDKHNMSIEEVKEIAESEDYVSLPLYLYDHSGITMNTTGFGCPWDSGQVGIIFVETKQACKELGLDYDNFNDEALNKIRDCLRSEVTTYDQFLTGDVWGYIIEDEDGDHIDSCWGFYGYDHCEEEANNALEYYKKHNPQQLELNI